MTQSPMEQRTGQRKAQRTGPRIWPWLTVVAVLAAIAVNALSNFFPPAGQNIGEVSNTVLGGVLITPASYAFVIWGLIYVGIIAYSLYQVLPAQRQNPVLAPILGKISGALIGACLFQILWVFAFLNYQFWLSVALMAGILICLAIAYLASRELEAGLTKRLRWIVQAPISLYFGWITIASVVNVASGLFATGLDRSNLGALSTVNVEPSGGAIVATVVMMVVSGVIAAIVALRYADVTYPGVAIWALVAIALRHANTYPSLAITGALLSVLLSVVIGRILTHRHPSSGELQLKGDRPA
jgi:hypothetical protein